MLAIFTDLYPRVMVSSTSPAFSLTVNNTASGNYSLKVMTIVAVVALPFVLAYQAWSYYVFRRRISAADFAGTPELPGGPRGGPQAALAATGSATAMSAADPQAAGDAGQRRAAHERPPRGNEPGSAKHGAGQQAGAGREATGTPTTDSAGWRAPRHRWHLPHREGAQVTDQHTGAARLTEAEFRALYDRLRAMPDWGPQDRRGALNYLTPDLVAAACRDVRLGRSVSMAAELADRCRAGQPRAGHPRAGDGRAGWRRIHGR